MRNARKKRGYTIEEMAEYLGFTSRHISDYELDKSKPTFESLCEIIRKLSLDANAIFFPERFGSGAVYISGMLYMLDDQKIDEVISLVEEHLKSKAGNQR